MPHRQNSKMIRIFITFSSILSSYKRTKFHIILSFLLFAAPLFATPKVVLFNDTSHWYHWGCTGTSRALIENMERLGFEVNGIPITATYSLKGLPCFSDFDCHAAFQEFIIQNEDVINAIQCADAVVITGEGTIHDLRDGPRALLYLAYISKQFFGKHVEIINHSAYPVDDPALSTHFIDNFQVEQNRDSQGAAQVIYKSVYSKLDFVAIREPLSRETMNQLGIDSTLSFDCLPLYIRDHYRAPKVVSENTLLIAGSVAFSDLGVNALSRYMEQMASRGFEIQVLIGASAFPSKDDQAFVERLRAGCCAPWTLIEATSIDEWLTTINNAMILVSGRFHHSIAAFCLNTPFIALNSNTPKVHAICEMLDHPVPLMYSDPALYEQLLARTEELISKGELDNTARILEICQLAERNFDGLRALRRKTRDGVGESR